MRLFSTVALSLALVASSGLVMPSAAFAQDEQTADARPKLELSKDYSKAIAPIQKAMGESKFAETRPALDAAAATVSTPDDGYHYGMVSLQFGVGAKDPALQRASLERLVENDVTPVKDKASYEQLLGQMYLIDDRNYVKAGELLQRAIDHGTVNATTYYQLAEAKFGLAIGNSGGRTINDENKALGQEGLNALKKAVETPMPDGSATPAGFFDRGFSIAQVISDDESKYWGKRLLEVSPTPENWHTVLLTYYSLYNGMNRQETVDLFRLMRQTNAFENLNEFDVYADAAEKLGLPGEAKGLIEWGRSTGALMADELVDLYQIVSGAAVEDQKTLASSATSAAKAETGRPAANTANAYLGYGDAAKAVELYKLALQKGGVDTDQVNTQLGIALALSGDKAGAQAAFAAVTGQTAPQRKAIAELWTIWLGQQA